MVEKQLNKLEVSTPGEQNLEVRQKRACFSSEPFSTVRLFKP